MVAPIVDMNQIDETPVLVTTIDHGSQLSYRIHIHCRDYALLSAKKQLGGVAEWSNAPVLKTGVPQGTGGSNPSPSAMLHNTLLISMLLNIK